MEFKHLEVFVKLVENLSFSVAAEELNISQPTVSLHIKQLEEELDTPLFIRSTRELKITEEGTILYREAKDLLQQRASLIDRFVNPNQKVLRIGSSTIPTGYILPFMLSRFRKDHPGILIQIEEQNSYETIKRISARKVDAGIVGMKTDDENCEFRAVYQDEFVFITPNIPYYRALQQTNPDLKRLAQEPLIVRESGSAVKQNMELMLTSANIATESLHIITSINNIEVIKRLVARGAGTSFISKIAVDDMVTRGELLAFSLENIPHRYRDLYLVWNKKITLPTYLQEFLDCAVAYSTGKK
ncbi:selenium metabolism-associated LysR family transcriptional regulator [Treponema vincentii]|uniref:selenium metabolism-associated LysR family transcriptional regulator n=1 Tax=Treponema vincentii TaxID=69710 RepID=UPI0035F5D35A